MGAVPHHFTEHRDCWKSWYEEEAARIAAFLPGAFALHHVGSTAIDGIWAKPIVDILMEIPQERSMEEVKEVLTRNGYRCMSEEGSRKSFNRGYTSDGFAERVFHLHLRYSGDHDELYFRDYMNAHPAQARAYERLKRSLLEQYEHDRDGYTNAKTAFVKEYTQRAKVESGERTAI